MTYTRRFVISAAHFNGARTYERYRAARAAEHDGIAAAVDNPSRAVVLLGRACELYQQVLADCHGHDFVITVEADPLTTRVSGAFVIEDEALEDLVRSWDRRNLSLVAALGGGMEHRATTEDMAHMLRKGIEARFGVQATVTIQEGPEIRVTSSWKEG